MRKHTLDFEVEKKLYEPDAMMQEKYQAFSAEVLRLALLLLTGYGFIYWEVTKMRLTATPLNHPVSSMDIGLYCAGLVFIVLSVMAALAHRAISTSGFDTRLYYGRLQTRIADASTHDEKRRKLAAEAEAEHKRMGRRYRYASTMVRLSSVFLGLAVAMTAVIGISTALRLAGVCR